MFCRAESTVSVCREFVDDITIPSKQGKGVLRRIDEVCAHRIDCMCAMFREPSLDSLIGLCVNRFSTAGSSPDPCLTLSSTTRSRTLTASTMAFQTTSLQRDRKTVE